MRESEPYAGLWAGALKTIAFRQVFNIDIADRSVEDVELVARVLIGGRTTNYYPAPIKYRDEPLPKKLRFGFYTSGLSRAS